MGEMLEDGTLFRQEPIQYRFPIMLVAAPENMVVSAGDDADSVKLHEAQPLDDAEHIQRPGRRSGKPLCIKQDATRIAVGNSKFHGQDCDANKIGGEGLLVVS